MKTELVMRNDLNCLISYYLVQRQVCAICGTNVEPTKHHIIPQAYLRYIPRMNKLHDIVWICKYCHNNYELRSEQFKKELAKKYNCVIPIEGIQTEKNKLLLELRRLCKSYLKVKNEYVKDKINSILNKNVSQDEIIYYSKLKIRMAICHYKSLLKNVENLQEFCELWREHFLKFTAPKFMPPYWELRRNIYE